MSCHPNCIGLNGHQVSFNMAKVTRCRICSACLYRKAAGCQKKLQSCVRLHCWHWCCCCIDTSRRQTMQSCPVNLKVISCKKVTDEDPEGIGICLNNKPLLWSRMLAGITTVMTTDTAAVFSQAVPTAITCNVIVIMLDPISRRS